MVYITAVHMAGGDGYEYISDVKWRNPGTGKIGESSKATMVNWIDNEGSVAKVQATPDVDVVTVDGTPKYLRTVANGKWTDNLLSLPRY